MTKKTEPLKPRSRGKVRKPPPRQIESLTYVSVYPTSDHCAAITVKREIDGAYVGLVYADEARRLAAWLLKFADWAESK
jgi:hypothetical protein